MYPECMHWAHNGTRVFSLSSASSSSFLLLLLFVLFLENLEIFLEIRNPTLIERSRVPVNKEATNSILG